MIILTSYSDEESAKVPLMADVGVITESTGSHQTDGVLTEESLQSLVRMSTYLGCGLGIITTPLLSIAGATIVAHVCLQLDVAFDTGKPTVALLCFIWGFFIAAALFYTQHLACKALLQRYNIEKAQAKTLEYVRVRLALGTLNGILVALMGQDLLRHGVDTRGLVMFGGLAVLIYFMVTTTQVRSAYLLRGDK